MVVFQGGKVHSFWMNGDAFGLNLGIFIAKTHLIGGENGKERGEVISISRTGGRNATGGEVGTYRLME